MTQALLESLKNSPALLRSLPEASLFDQSWLKMPHRENLSTLKFRQKLGHVTEDALSLLIEHSPDLDLIGRNIQVQESPQKTLGELDFLLTHRQQPSTIHLELATKYYLATQDRHGQWSYPGPNSSDNWHKKLQRLISHQFTLSEHPATKRLLKERFDISSPLRVQHLIIGRFFHHLSLSNPPLPTAAPPLPRAANTSLGWGQWLRLEEFSHYFDHQEVFILPKALWSSPSHSIQSLLSPTSVSQLLLLAQNQCTMFQVPDNMTSFFLVPNQWNKPIE